ncbi:hypothetical protein ScalyP_jg4201 [Parmales sp. scaly parma]|nr:hypothetical protein ScalyP_jg4201 [Parmales sp. scaly parma]
MRVVMCFLLSVLAPTSFALPSAYSIIRSSQPHCVSVEVPSDTPLRVGYHSPDKYPGDVTISVKLDSAKGPNKGWNALANAGKKAKSGLFNQFKIDTTLLTEEVKSGDVSKEGGGSISVRTVSSGIHRICGQVLLASSENPIRLGLSVEMGEGSQHYEELNMEKHLSEMQIQVIQLNDQMKDILKEADYMKGVEVEFHNQSININSASKWWPILQCGVLLMMGLVQYRHLKQFFEKKKLV